MIRLRHSNGEPIDLPPEVAFVELVNVSDGTVGTVFLQPKPGVVLQLHPGTRDAARYERLFQKHGVKFSPALINRDLRHG